MASCIWGVTAPLVRGLLLLGGVFMVTMSAPDDAGVSNMTFPASNDPSEERVLVSDEEEDVEGRLEERGSEPPPSTLFPASDTPLR